MTFGKVLMTVTVVGLAIAYYRRYENDIIEDIDTAWEKWKEYRQYTSKEDTLNQIRKEVADSIIRSRENENTKINYNNKIYKSFKDLLDDYGITYTKIKTYMTNNNCELEEAMDYFLNNNDLVDYN